MAMSLLELHYIYTPELRNVILRNWLCNPTGKLGQFRGVDWLVERNNLYTKVSDNICLLLAPYQSFPIDVVWWFVL